MQAVCDRVTGRMFAMFVSDRDFGEKLWVPRVRAARDVRTYFVTAKKSLNGMDIKIHNVLKYKFEFLVLKMFT